VNISYIGIVQNAHHSLLKYEYTTQILDAFSGSTALVKKTGG